jgi:uncharacterized small protein (DUF1192 family)
MDIDPEGASSREALEEQILALRAEVERLRAELARARRDQHERPPHWEA